MIADHRLAPRNGGTEVELSFRSECLVANIVGSIFSKMIGEYVAIEARSLKAHSDNLAKAASKQERRAGDPGPSDADLKAARDARYAARKGRKR